MMNEVQSILRTADSFAAVEQIQRDGTPLEIAARYQSLIPDLYWKARDLPAIVTIGRAGIIYCLSQSLLTGCPNESVDKLRSTAKALAYNVASFAWPGWEEPGIDPSPAEIAVGLDCAMLNLRLAVELKKPSRPLAAAHWMLGAYALVMTDFTAAAKAFQAAADLPPETEESATGDSVAAMQRLYQGYHAIARIGIDPSDAAAKAGFDQITLHFRDQAGEDAKGFLSQLLSARRIFAPAIGEPFRT